MYDDRIRCAALREKITSAEEAAQLVNDGMRVGASGFTRAGDAKAVPIALARRAREANEPLRITLMTGASLGHDVDRMLTEAGVLARRLPFQVDATLRQAINRGEVMFVDQHLSETVEMLRANQLGKLDLAIIEAAAITETGGIVPTTSVGNSASFAILAERVIVEINLAQPLALEGLHDIWIPGRRPHRDPLPIVRPQDRVGQTAIEIPPSKIAAIVLTDTPDSSSTVLPADEETAQIAGHLIEFLQHEVSRGRMPSALPPLQAASGRLPTLCYPASSRRRSKPSRSIQKCFRTPPSICSTKARSRSRPARPSRCRPRVRSRCSANSIAIATGSCCVRKKSATIPR